MQKPELLSPVGDFESLKSSIANGADAIYLGSDSFNARQGAQNFNDDELSDAIKYAKLRNVRVYLTLNTLIKNTEIKEALSIAINAYNAGVDAIIVQDLGLAQILNKAYPFIPLHASTQMTVLNADGVKNLKDLGFKRVVLARELSINDIKDISSKTNMELEIFIHGALCMSYSGQCLLSSMIGGNSGNRGCCKQPCRLPYKLFEDEKLLDDGYLLSTRDNFGLEFLPELIKLGVTSFKIEGRMKSASYIGVITSLYRKYIDLVYSNINLSTSDLKEMISQKLNEPNSVTLLTDLETFKQVFNRGGLSKGHFTKNKDLVYKAKPNNMGLFIGNTTSKASNEYININLKTSLSIGDKISILDKTYTVTDLKVNSAPCNLAPKDTIATIGKIRDKVPINQKVYRVASIKLNKEISSTYKGDTETKKIGLTGKITIKSNKKIELVITSDDGIYNGLKVAVKGAVPQIAKTMPITNADVKTSILKTGGTEFYFKKLDIILDNNLFVNIKDLNNLRKKALNEMESLALKTFTRNISLEDFNLHLIPKNTKDSKTKHDQKKISLLINLLKKDLNYTSLKGIDRIYIPLKYFVDENYNGILNEITNRFNLYIYMPNILKDSTLKTIDFKNLSTKFSIKGFIVSNIAQIEILKNLNLELIGNFTLNIINNYSNLKNLNLNEITASMELNKYELNEFLKLSPVDTEVLVYGKVPVMTTAYCFLSNLNYCDENCTKKCLSNNKFYLKDRLNLKFRIVPDKFSSTTTIYNSKIQSLDPKNVHSTSFRIDILDESLSDIQNIINTVKQGKKFSGENYTNGYFK